MDLNEHAEHQQELKDQSVADQPEAQGREPVVGEELPDAYDSAKVLAAGKKPLDGPDGQTPQFATEPAPMINTTPPVSFPVGGIQDTLAEPVTPQNHTDWADILAHDLERLLAAVTESGSLNSGSYVAVKGAAANHIAAWWASKSQDQAQSDAKAQKSKRIGQE